MRAIRKPLAWKIATLLAVCGGFWLAAPLEMVGASQSDNAGRQIWGVDFNRDIHPIPSGKCSACHGAGASGEKIEKHWSFIAPRRPKLPAVKNKTWPRNAVDYFVLARLEREGIAPASEADRATLIRRLSFDLTGLPPTPKEVDAFLKDRSPRAYEKLVDRLLTSPRYGERMAFRWLDAARYADTNGYQRDDERYMWRWRDWVIEAFNQNKPYDQFTIEQIAGDLLPSTSLDQKIATGFNRNHRGNAEDGIIPEEYAVEYVMDRVDTTATVWLGLTIGCARCHNHKYDPITQKEYYRLYAYFNNIPENGKAVRRGNSPPFIPAPTKEQRQQLDRIELQIAETEKVLAQVEARLPTAPHPLERSLARPSVTGSGQIVFPTGALVAYFTLDEAIEFLNGSDVKRQPGRVGRAAVFDGKSSLNGGTIANFDHADNFTLAAWIYPIAAEGGAIIARAREAQGDKSMGERMGTGYGLLLEDGKLQFNLISDRANDAVRVETQDRIALNQWLHVAVSYDGSGKAGGVRIYVDGQPQILRAGSDQIFHSAKTNAPLRIGGVGAGKVERFFHGLIDEARIYDAVLTPEQMVTLAKRLLALQRERADLEASFPTVMVMQEMDKPRETFILRRGSYDAPGERVERDVPAALPPLPAGAPNNRLGLAQWLAHPSNPLTSRVAVNRFWQMFFGVGIVKTTEDLGAQGERPSHPELLDWLAVEFQRAGWDLKRLLKTMVMSATYRQSSIASPNLLHRDPENRLLARGPRFRLPSEMIRDQALFVSGLLVEQIGGPSVKGYQPEGLYNDLVFNETKYAQDHGDKLYRRSLYTFWKRTIAPPFMMTFDAANREVCIVRETRTNTPLQALNLMNDVTFVEAARLLAERMLKEGGTSTTARLRLAFRALTSRQPSATEVKILSDNLAEHFAYFDRRPAEAARLLSVGEKKHDEKLKASELAAYTMVASLILNLDEVVTKE